MTTTLARRIRRIGLLPTTYKTVKEEVLGKDEQGAEAIITHTKKIPVRHRERLSADTQQKMIDDMRAAAKAKRLARRAANKK